MRTGLENSNGSGVRLRDVTKTFADATVVDRLTLDIPSGRLVALLGPSGCGKTTTLRMLGGFESPDSGSIALGERDVTDLAPWKREINTVFQSYALFPHLDVARNVSFGLERSGVGRDERRRRVADVLDLVQMTGMERRRPNQLSGGQQQRVALARALVNRPKVLLLDEPLGALDLRLRKQLQVELKRIHQEVGLTFVHVTHDQEEAMSMADTIAVMRDGRIEQLGDAATLYERPATRFVANFLGASNLLAGHVVSVADGRVEFVTRAGARLAAHSELAVHPGDALCLGVRPEKVALHAPGADAGTDNVLAGRVTMSSFLGTTVQWHVEVEVEDAGALVVVDQNRGGRQPAAFGAGAEVQLRWSPEHTFLVGAEPAVEADA